jgi:hypothetical protein
MAKYNILRNSFVTTVISGSYNKQLSCKELSRLMDYNTTTSGVLLSSSDNLCIQVDLGNRLTVDGIYLYTDNDSVFSSIDVYYKNEAYDSFLLTQKQRFNDYYSFYIPDPSAPSKLLCTVSGVNIELFEFVVFNNDYDVNFGEDGTSTVTWLRDTPVGSYGKPQEVLIYNNDASNKPVNAYACIDYVHGSDTASYIQIATNKNGPFIGYSPEAILGENNKSWVGGTLDNVVMVENTLQLASTGVSGYLSELPLTNCNYHNDEPFGVRNCVAYDEEHNIIYAIFYNGTSYDNGILKLYKYDILSAVWSFVSELYYGIQRDVRAAAACYVDNYIYYVIGARLYRYDLNGLIGNYEYLHAFGYSPNTNPGVCLVAYSSDILYVVKCSRPGSQIYTNFIRYTISSNNEYSLPIPYMPNITIYKYVIHLVLNKDKNEFYFICSNLPEGHRYDYIQKFSINENIWYKLYLHTNVLNFKDTFYMTMAYKNNMLYFMHPDNPYKVAAFSINTENVTFFESDFTFDFRDALTLLITKPYDSRDSFSLFGFSLKKAVYYMGGYNVVGSTTPLLSEGTYTSPILILDDKLKASYFKTFADTRINKTSVSKDPTMYNGTMEVRSSNTPPEMIDELYWPYTLYSCQNVFRVGAGKYDFITDIFEKCYITTSFDYRIGCAAIDLRRGYLWFLVKYSYRYHAFCYDLYNKQLKYDHYFTGYNYALNNSYNASIDYSGNYWFYEGDTSELRCVTYNITHRYTYTVAHLVDMSASKFENTCWVVETQNNDLIKFSVDMTALVTVHFLEPGGVTSTPDGGCWVIENRGTLYDHALLRYDILGNLMTTKEAPEFLSKLSLDPSGGFYACARKENNKVFYFDSEGILVREITGVNGIDYINAGKYGCVFFNSSLRLVQYYSYEKDSIIWTKLYQDDIYSGTNGYRSCTVPVLFWRTFEEENSEYNKAPQPFLPKSTETLWTDTGLPWREVPLNGYYLYKHKYQQLRLTLRNFDGKSTPIVHATPLAPVIKINDINSLDTKPIYVRSNVPDDAANETFDSSIRVWWEK